MSEFRCYNGHLMPSGKAVCDCGASLYTMDGEANRESNQREYDEMVRPDEEEECDNDVP